MAGRFTAAEYARDRAIVLSFLIYVLQFAAVLAVLGGPVWVVAWRHARPATMYRFGVAGLVVAMFAAANEVLSDRLVSQCEAAGNTACVDIGGAGTRLTVLGGFAIVAWWRVYVIRSN